MAEFVCKVADPAGRVFSHVEAAQSVAEARQKLSDRGLYVYSVQPRGGLLGRTLGHREGRLLKSSDFLIFNQQFNTLIKAGLPILKALDLLAERAASPSLQPLLRDVRDKVREGAALSEALDQQGLFPKVYVTSILAGEKSGSLSGVLDYYIAYQKLSTSAKKKLIATLIYPTILVTVATIIVTYLVTYVVPQFAKLYSDMNVPLPGVTRLLLTITVSYRFDVLIALALLLAGALGVFLWSRTDKGGTAVDRMKLKLPLVGETWIKFQVAQFCRTLSTLLAGGTPLVGALSTSAESVRSRLVSSAIQEASALVRDGQSLHAALRSTGLMPAMGIEMIEVGEASGALSPMLGSVAEFYEDETNQRIGTLIAVVEPAILVFMAIVIAFILISLYLPIFSFSVGAGPG
ncbi:MAG TPA: type II secretion system F family protein [Rugosimonospora sp.]|nr:type II secretion system F family protein [Rugosimonospora sp.]